MYVCMHVYIASVIWSNPLSANLFSYDSCLHMLWLYICACVLRVLAVIHESIIYFHIHHKCVLCVLVFVYTQAYEEKCTRNKLGWCGYGECYNSHLHSSIHKYAHMYLRAHLRHREDCLLAIKNEHARIYTHIHTYIHTYTYTWWNHNNFYSQYIHAYMRDAVFKPHFSLVQYMEIYSFMYTYTHTYMHIHIHTQRS